MRILVGIAIITLIAVASADGHTQAGTDWADTMVGHAHPDALWGRKGNDTILGYAGNDRLSGNEHRDTIYAGVGHDFANGGLGDDRIDGGPGGDILHGGYGDDTIVDSSGQLDQMYPGAGLNFVDVSGDPRYSNDTVYCAWGDTNDIVRLDWNDRAVYCNPRGIIYRNANPGGIGI